MSIRDYWDLTPRQFDNAIAGYNRRLEDLDLLNYIHASYARSKNFPKEPTIAKLPKTTAKPMDLDQLASQLGAK